MYDAAHPFVYDQRIRLCMMRLEKVTVSFQKKLIDSSSKLCGEVADLFPGRGFVLCYGGRILQRLG